MTQRSQVPGSDIKPWLRQDPRGYLFTNVNIVDEFVNMILAQRSYESNSRVVKASDEMLQQLNQLAQ